MVVVDRALTARWLASKMGTGSIDATRLQLVGSPFNPVPSAYSGSPGRERPSPWPSHLHRLSRHFELALRHECHIPTGKHQAPGARVGTCSGRAGRAKAPAPRHPHAAPCPCLIFDLSCCPVPALSLTCRVVQSRRTTLSGYARTYTRCGPQGCGSLFSALGA